MEIDEQRAAIRALIRSMMEATGLDATHLAKAAGVAPSTLTRFLNQPVKHLLTARTLAKLSKASGMAVPAGGPTMTPAERELLASFRTADEEAKAMMLRFGRSLRADSPATPTRPRGADPPHPTVGGTGRKIKVGSRAR